MSPASSLAIDRAAELFATNPGRVGASTGFMVADRGNWSALVDQAAAISTRVSELSALSASELPALAAFLAEVADLPFEALSVHGPAKGVDARHSPELASALASLPAQVDGIVMHPETIAEPDGLRILGSRLRLENMDTRKSDGKTVEQLERYFAALPEACFCLDVGHAQLNDPSMGLAHELLDAFGDRLAEVHLSSILESGNHVPLQAPDVDAFWPVLERCIGVPWVLEAPPPASYRMP
jgi:hypothetical protein